MKKEEIIQRVNIFVKEVLNSAERGHDYWHALRVWNNVKMISKDYSEINNLELEVAALIHDVNDYKFEDLNTQSNDDIRDFLKNIGISESKIEFIFKLIENVSFSSQNIENFHALELDILQDADRLDAIGAIGIARAFSYVGFRKREFYNPEIEPNLNMTKEEYKKSESTTINHFYEKLLLLKDDMKTKKGKEIAVKRHQFMLEFLQQFFKEWGGEDS